MALWIIQDPDSCFDLFKSEVLSPPQIFLNVCGQQSALSVCVYLSCASHSRSLKTRRHTVTHFKKSS